MGKSRDFQNSSPFERSICFDVIISENFERFANTFSLKQIFSKTKTFFKKPEYRVLVESAKSKNT